MELYFDQERTLSIFHNFSNLLLIADEGIDGFDDAVERPGHLGLMDNEDNRVVIL